MTSKLVEPLLFTLSQPHRQGMIDNDTSAYEYGAVNIHQQNKSNELELLLS